MAGTSDSNAAAGNNNEEMAPYLERCTVAYAALSLVLVAAFLADQWFVLAVSLKPAAAGSAYHIGAHTVPFSPWRPVFRNDSAPGGVQSGAVAGTVSCESAVDGLDLVGSCGGLRMAQAGLIASGAAWLLALAAGATVSAAARFGWWHRPLSCRTRPISKGVALALALMLTLASWAPVLQGVSRYAAALNEARTVPDDEAGEGRMMRVCWGTSALAYGCFSFLAMTPMLGVVLKGMGS